MNIKEYLSEHNTVEIKVGQSGAGVYEIDGKYILKYVARRNTADELFDTYTREALFYREQTVHPKAYLPKVLETEVSDNEILILMKKYNCLERSAINEELIGKIARALAMLHTDKVPPFIGKDEKGAKLLHDQEISESVSGWNSVLAEHSGMFDGNALDEIAEEINELILWHDSEERVLVHGDCHWDNLLQDEKGNILLCDWQGIDFGAASGDLSFLISRLGGDGCTLDTAVLLDHYVNAVLEFSGKRIEAWDITCHLNAANVITSFLFWHSYLHDNEEERVREIFDKMIKDFKDCRGTLDKSSGKR